MDMNTVITILGYVLTVVFGIIARILKNNQNVAKIKKDLFKLIPQLIDQAEDEYKDIAQAGGQKMEWCVNTAFRVLPGAKVLFTEDEMEEKIQLIFDFMENYASQQLDSILEKTINK